jgi:hypothetical protein
LTGSFAGTLGNAEAFVSTLSFGSSSTWKMSRNDVGATTKVVLSLATGIASAVFRSAGLLSGGLTRAPGWVGSSPDPLLMLTR